jgi:signal transduction histidine kinase
MGLRARFAIWFSGAALVPIVATTFIAYRQISSGYRDDFERKLAAAHEDAQRAFDRIRDSVRSAVDAAGENPMVKMVLLELDKNGRISNQQQAELTRSGGAMMHSLGLDVLTITDGSDTVLASPHFIGHVYQSDAEPRRLARDRPGSPIVAWARVQREREGTVSPLLVVEAARTVRDDLGGEITVLCGRELGAELLRPLHGDGVEARLTDDQRRSLMATAGAERGGAAGAPAQDLVLADVAGKPIAHVIVSVSDAALRRRLHDLALLSAGLGLGAALLAAALGFLVSRRLTRDLHAVVRGVQAVSRGDLEARVDVRARDEVGELAAAFNKMTADLLKSKDALLQAERVAAWQEIARRLAHEIKNPLTPIQMSVETLRKTHAAGHPSFEEIFAESTRTVLDEVGRLKKIVGEFSEFARMPRPERRSCDLNEVVASALSLYRGSVKVVKELEEPLPAVDADRDQLTQVVLNLLENARDAVTAKGSDDSVGRISVRTRAGGGGGGAVELEVEDNGAGFDPAITEKLFRPYYTTKDAGTGLGLAIVRRIVTDHGGRITAHSAPGRGARFVVELPTAA